MRVKNNVNGFVRRPDEQEKFQHLLRVLVWAKNKTGKSSAEVASLILRRGKEGIERHFSQ